MNVICLSQFGEAQGGKLTGDVNTGINLQAFALLGVKKEGFGK